jgi:hypothetical protein
MDLNAAKVHLPDAGATMRVTQLQTAIQNA